jgi:RNA polymerase sigma-70 factor, ECF subfamily
LKPDAQLVQGCIRGDGPAWEELVRRHARRVFNLCYRFTSNRTDAEDLSQEVFLRIYRTLPSYRPAYGAFPTWLTSVTRNLLVDHYRRTKHDRVTDSIEDSPHVAEKPSTARTPEKMAQASELSAQLQQGLARLSPDLREAVILRDLHGLDYIEIQAVLQVAEGTVKSRINRGRIELARVLEEMGMRNT